MSIMIMRSSILTIRRERGWHYKSADAMQTGPRLSGSDTLPIKLLDTGSNYHNITASSPKAPACLESRASSLEILPALGEAEGLLSGRLVKSPQPK